METYSWYNVAVVLFAAFGSLFTGYSLAVFGTTLGQPTFYTSLGLVADTTAPGYAYTDTILGAANGVFFGAGALGCLWAGWLGNRFGRVLGFRVAAITGIVGGALETGSQSPAMFLVARVIAGFAAGHTMAALPTYFTEVSPPHSRGLIAGAHGFFINIGYMISGWVGVGCYYAADTTFSWRFPFSLVILFAICLLVGSFWGMTCQDCLDGTQADDQKVPESPRYLVQKDRHSDALAILIRLHHDPNDPANHFAHQELDLIQARCQIENGIISRDGRWRLFTKKANRKRLFLGVMVMIGGMNIGTLVINNYNVLLYGRLGLGPTTSLELAAGYNTVGVLMNGISLIVSDRIGRRRAMLIGYTSVTCVFAILTGFIAKFNETPTKGWAAAATTMVFLFVTCYNPFIDSNQFIIATEIFPTHVRQEAAGIAISGLFFVDVLWLDLLPTAIADIGWKYYLVFACLCVAHTTYLFFYLPETVGFQLEEMDDAMEGDARKHTKIAPAFNSEKLDAGVEHVEIADDVSKQ